MRIRSYCIALILTTLAAGCGSSDNPFGFGWGGKSEDNKASATHMPISGRAVMAGQPMGGAKIEVELYRMEKDLDDDGEVIMTEKVAFRFTMNADSNGVFSYDVPLATSGKQASRGIAKITFNDRLSLNARFNVPLHLEEYTKIDGEIKCINPQLKTQDGKLICQAELYPRR